MAGLLALVAVATGLTGATGPDGRGSLAVQRVPSQVSRAVTQGTVPAAVPPSVTAAAAAPAQDHASILPIAVAPASGTAAGEAVPSLAGATSVLASASAGAAEAYYAQLRSRLRWVPVRVGQRQLPTPDAGSRLLLAQAAARRAELHEVGLDYRDVYGVINAETSWVPRTGMGRNGVASHGLAQFEPATARAVGLRDPNDAVEAVHAAAMHLREAAHWSARRIAPLALPADAYAQKLREGISIYYNLSSRGRRAWNGLNTDRLPVETQRHIRNVERGMRQAEQLQARVDTDPSATGPLMAWSGPAAAEAEREPRRAAAPAPRRLARTQTAAAPQGHGTIEWSNGGGGRKVWVLQGGRVLSAHPRNG